MTHTTKNKGEQITRNMDVNGHRITLVFATAPDPNLSKLVRSTLIDSFLQKNCSADGKVELSA